jgi:feruloyl esterase
MSPVRILPLLFCLGGAPALTASCGDLTALTIPGTTITSAVAVPAGPFSPNRGGGRGGGAQRAFPAFCRVAAVARPVADSEIHVEIWLPESGAWNGKLLGTGNGGYSGDLGYVDMERGLRLGYAVAGSDTGHEGGDLKFGLGHPEKINDWAWRAVHVMTNTAKLVMRSYYGRFAAHAYFSGCSTGGQQALTEAQRFPDDYDGILAGAPGNNRVRLNIGFLWSWLAANGSAASSLPASKLPLLHKAVVTACDALDGVKDGIIGDPRACHFDPAALECRGEDAADCLTKGQVAAVRAIYDGAKNPRTGDRLYSGWAPGSEAGWTGYFVGQREPARLDFWRYWVFDDPNWDFRSFDFDRDVAYADSRMEFLTANDPELKRFQRRGGRLLIYQGWADPVVPPEDTIRYYETVVRAAGEGAAPAVARLFLIPGMGHCSGGPGPSTFDGLGALDSWVTQGTAPSRIVATHSTNGAVDRSRPLCPYPQTPRWKGAGSTDDAASFECVAPRP